MAALAERILTLIQQDSWGLSWHANETIQDRSLEIWQIVALTPSGRVLREVVNAKPRPKVEIEIILPDGTSAKTIWAYDAHLQRAVLVTAHFFD